MAPLSWRTACVLLAGLSPALAAAQAAPQLPASLVTPNYDRVFVGLEEAHEAGAYAARTSGPAASWYNPAGLATVERTAVSINARGVEMAFVSLPAPLPSSAQVSAANVLPLFLAVALGPDLVPWKDVRLAFSGTQQTSWSNLAWWGETDATGHWSYVTDANLSSYVVAASLGWAVSPGLRLGASLGGGYTRLYEDDRLSALTADAQVQGTVRTRLLSGTVLHVLPTLALQWDAAPWLGLGLVARLPGMRVWGQATLQGERQDTTSAGSQNTFLQTGQADFDYRYPLALGGALAVRRPGWELELDVRWHDGTGPYQLVSTDAPVQTVTTPPGGPPSTAPYVASPYEARAVVDVALGGRWSLSPAVQLHGGLYASPSPVVAGSTWFRQSDVYGLRAGVSFVGQAWAGSVGLGYETGESSASPALAGLGATPVDGSVRIQQVSLVLAGEYRP